MAHVTEIGDSDFADKVERKSGIVVVDFWAPWCGPCVAFAPQLDKIAERYSGKIDVYKLNVQDHQETPIKFGVSAVPTLIVFKNGVESARIVGVNLQQLLSAIDGAIGSQN
ncbi:thioredoxin [Anaplasma phagocytophilum]|uniref:Thioredoxin n=2 Tax=Anaplasma phagocytophilum TaxID=948 RepID=Q2GLP0_ANAPZ|nr:thioredoxin [Anaplasma phagocytophilum]KJV67564.1 thioredoxin [Anaplasma phagocytophilum str. ApNP]KJZ98933.1 thioredoxin [Anaplasma phagocytophilum str. CR1007]ABD44347.1 thioredoxin [Anaplasma phagocytophilum str. HZ]AGR78589.1 thioredoxin [Anaplasma phagocytophilum str. HZ2]AGR79836.1 thioredoxin [Anaplasma phagocytophilum str. JM]